MIDLNELKAPGWQRIVAELSADVPDDKIFFQRLMQVLAQVTAAHGAVLFLPDRLDGEEVEPRVESVWSASGTPGAEADPQQSLEHMAELTNAARAAFGSSHLRVYALEQSDLYYDSGSKEGFVVAIPLIGGQGRPLAVVSLQLEARSRDALRSTLAMAEVLSGYTFGHAARQRLRDAQRASFAFDLATRLIASINQADGFKGATIQLCNDMAKQFGVDRVALGWVKGDRVRLTSLSDTEHFDRRMAMVQKIEAAADECYDQDQPILFPQPPESGDGGDVLLSQAIVHAHRELAAGNAKLRVASLPLRDEEDVLGVVTIESTGEGEIDVATIEMMQAAMDLVSPVLRIRRSDDRILPARAWASTLKAGAWALGPKHTAWKLAGVGVAALLLFVTLFRTPYLVTAEATIQPREKRIISMPLEGVVQRLHDEAKVSSWVDEGQVLLELDASEYKLALAETNARVIQAVKRAEAARRERDTAAAATAELEAERFRSQAKIYERKIEKSLIRAPISGQIVEGDLRERVGSTMKLGDPLFVIARMDDLVIVARVDERDIDLVRNSEGLGTLATKSSPNLRHDVEVEQILQVAQPDEGKNIFQVRAAIAEPTEGMRTGMEGLARFKTETHSLAWIGTRRVLDTVRLWLWK